MKPVKRHERLEPDECYCCNSTVYWSVSRPVTIALFLLLFFSSDDEDKLRAAIILRQTPCFTTIRTYTISPVFYSTLIFPVQQFQSSGCCLKLVGEDMTSQDFSGSGSRWRPQQFVCVFVVWRQFGSRAADVDAEEYFFVAMRLNWTSLSRLIGFLQRS